MAIHNPTSRCLLELWPSWLPGMRGWGVFIFALLALPLTDRTGWSIRRLAGDEVAGSSATSVAAEQAADWGDRPLWTTSRLNGFPDPPPPFELQRAYPSLQFSKLIGLNSIPDSSYLLAIVHEKDWGGPGRVEQFVDSEDVESTEEFLEMPEIIYGLAFDPNFADNRFVYVGCNGQSEHLGEVATRVIRYKVDGEGPFRCDPESRQLIIEWPSNGHNGGDLAFGNDRMLYVTAGDGTSDSDTLRNGQNLNTLAGSLLRIDVQGATSAMPYQVPDDNPFHSIPEARPEIWAYGLRNPWRLSYDAESDQLWIGNNGQDLWESVYLVRRGANYGWSIKESNHPFHTDQDSGPAPISPATVEHHHSEARSLTGGHVYRGDLYPELAGAYVYGDYSTGNIWAVRCQGDEIVHQRLLATSRVQIAGFGRDSSGELLVADHAGGIYRFVPQQQESAIEFPRRLSATGLFAHVATQQPQRGVLPYSVNSPLWSDGAAKMRWLAVPGEQTISHKPRGAWEFPEGTVLVKTFAFPAEEDGRLRNVETRLLAKQQGEWFGYSYRWNDDQTDALLVEAEGRAEQLDWTYAEGHRRSTAWRYPSRSECMVCHTRAANYVLGLSTEQMDRQQAYLTVSGEQQINQLQMLRHLGLFGESYTSSGEPPLADPSDAGASIDRRARSYLHANCAVCHVEAGGGNSKIDLSHGTSAEQMGLFLQSPLHGRLGTDRRYLVTPGEPDDSILLLRMSHRGPGQMPPLATYRVDESAVRLLEEWIGSLDSDYGQARNAGSDAVED